MTSTQSDKVARFRALHAAPGAFVIPNPWDAGSARMLAHLGFQALATSSSATAGTLGRRDLSATREEALALARRIVDATDLPVSADLEDCFGDSPADVATTLRLAREIGLAGCSVEDAATRTSRPYDLGLSVERVAAAVEVAHSGPFQLVLTARAENFIRGNPNLDDTIKRLQAYERAGADVLFAPGLPNLDAVRAVCSSVSKPVNVIGFFLKGPPPTVAELAAVGAKRISLAAGLYRYAMAALRDAAQEIQQQGTLTFTSRAVSNADMNAFLPE